jgi:putative membrane protein
MKTITSLMLAAVLFAGLVSCGNKKTETEDSKEVAEEQNDQKFDETKTEDDTEFAVEAADGGMFEVQLGQLAQANASSAEVKNFAKMMVDDHSKANDELKATAAQKNISLPGTLSDKCQKKYDELAGKTGEEFDKAYIDLMVSDHEEDLDAFKKEAEKGNDADLKAWAAGKVPTLQHHLDAAKTAQDAVKNKKK